MYNKFNVIHVVSSNVKVLRQISGKATRKFFRSLSSDNYEMYIFRSKLVNRKYQIHFQAEAMSKLELGGFEYVLHMLSRKSTRICSSVDVIDRYG